MGVLHLPVRHRQMMKVSKPNHEAQFRCGETMLELAVDRTGFVLVDLWYCSGVPEDILPAPSIVGFWGVHKVVILLQHQCRETPADQCFGNGLTRLRLATARLPGNGNRVDPSGGAQIGQDSLHDLLGRLTMLVLDDELVPDHSDSSVS